MLVILYALAVYTIVLLYRLNIINKQSEAFELVFMVFAVWPVIALVYLSYSVAIWLFKPINWITK